MVAEESSSISGNLSAAYINTNGSAERSWLTGGSSLTDALAAVNAVYSASILASKEIKRSPRDLWGWPKIPLLRTLPPVDSSGDIMNPWRTFDSSDSNTAYSYLVGVVLRGVPRDRDAEFPTESSYLDLGCHLIANDLSGREVFEKMGPDVLVHNATNLFNTPSQDGMSVTISNFFIDTSYNFTAPSRNQAEVNLFFGSHNRPVPWNAVNVSYDRNALFNCTISNIHVESWIACRNSSCAVMHMRQSEMDRQPSSWTPWNVPGTAMEGQWPSTLQNFISQLPAAMNPISDTASSPTDSYIYGDEGLFAPRGYERHWSDVSEHDVSSRLTAAFNTYCTTGTTSRTIEIYRTNFGWVSGFVIGTVLLQICAIAALYLKSVTIAPNILGYVSSMTRDNPYTLLPRGASVSSGPERARLLRDMKVQIIDVQGRRDTGYIALASEATIDETGQMLNRRRQYE